MSHAEGSDPCVVNDRAADARALHEAGEYAGEIVRLVEQVDGGRAEPRLDLRPRFGGIGGAVLPDPYARDGAEELVDARPGYGPRLVALGKLAHEGASNAVLRRLATMRVDEDVGVDSEHQRPP